MGVITSGLGSDWLVTQGYAAYLDGDSAGFTIDFAIENVVTSTDQLRPLTGVFTNDIDGWQYDKRKFENLDNIRTRFETYAGGHVFGLLDGVPKGHWQSGTIDGLSYKDIANYYLGDHKTWTPRVSTGDYSTYWNVKTLYSDYSYSQNINRNHSENSLNKLILRNDCLENTISVAIWKRDDTFTNYKICEFEYVDEFTGRFVSSERISTLTEDGNLIPENIDPRAKEYTIIDGALYLSGDHYFPIGYAEQGFVFDNMLAAGTISDLWESKGQGSENGRNVYTNYFPIQPGTVSLVTKSETDIITEWTEVESLALSSGGDLHYEVDYDLGIIKMGGYKAEDLLLANSLSPTATTLTVYNEKETLDDYGHQGVIIIDGEEIFYAQREGNVFSGCLRGYNGSMAASHAAGVAVSDKRHGQGTLEDIYIAYVAIPRVDYEVTNCSIRSTHKQNWLDIQPIKNIYSNNILQLISYEPNLQEIILETDSLLIGGELYGPVYYGTDVSNLTARGLDANGNPADEIELTINILSGQGSLNGFAQSYSSFTNSLGEIYSFYNAPYDPASLERTVTNVAYVDGNTEITLTDLQSDIDVNDVWIYQILKHDESLGSVGLEAEVVTEDNTTVFPYGNATITIDKILERDDYIGGWLYLIGSDGIKYRREIITVFDTLDIDDKPVSQLGLSASFPSGVAVGESAYLFRFDAVEWNATLLNGKKVILYEYREDVLHPITKVAGAYTPLHPDRIVGNTLIFEDRLLPQPGPADLSTNLGGYAIIAPSQATIQAYGTDPVTGRVIFSNIVRLSLEMPLALIGVDNSGVLPIPYGWTFISEEFNVGSALGGANFITINPQATGINQFNLYGVF